MPADTHTHQTFKRYEPKVHGNRYCQHISYVNGALRMCEEPTHGRTYCPSCAMHLITLTDRVATQPAQTEPVNWRAQGPTRDRRKTKAA